jgi:hypothetical protein
MLYVDISFVNNVAVLVRNFKRKPGQVFNFSCPLCGDSSKDKSKARAYFYPNETGSDLLFKCHNCSQSMLFGNFLKRQFPEIYDSYILEKFKNKNKPLTKKKEQDTIKEQVKEDLKNMVQVSELSETDIGRKFCIQRKLPDLDRLYFTDDWAALAEEFIPGKYENMPKNDPRIVLVYRDIEGKITGLQGRAILQSKQRYISAAPKHAKMVFGAEKLDRSKKVYVVEGPFDSMFLPNAVAVGTSDLESVEKRIGELQNAVYVFDNQPRNKEICKLISRAIDNNKKVVIWPDFIKEKDINDMILSSYAPDIIQGIIDENTFEGISAKVIFGEWKKC